MREDIPVVPRLIFGTVGGFLVLFVIAFFLGSCSNIWKPDSEDYTLEELFVGSAQYAGVVSGLGAIFILGGMLLKLALPDKYKE